MRIVAFGMSQQEARSFAMLKLINSIGLLRRILQAQNEIDDVNSLISKTIRNSTRPSFLDPNCAETINVGLRLCNFYARLSDEPRTNNDIWHSIEVFTQDILKNCPAKVQPLIKYYFVTFLSVFVLSLMETYSIIRQRRLAETIKTLSSLQRQNLRPFFYTLVSRQLDDLEQTIRLRDQVFSWPLTKVVSPFSSRN